MAFSPDFLDEIRGRVRLADVIGRRVRLVRKGREYVGLCPFHKEKTPSFTVNEDKGFFHCFGCGAHGDVIGFVMQAEGLAFPEAVERLAGQAGLALPAREALGRAAGEAREALYAVLEAACAWFERRLRLPDSRAAWQYLKDRGFADETLARFRIGFAPEGRDGLISALAGEGVSVDRLVETGLAVRPEDGRPPYDRFRRRIVFPIIDRRGRVVAFGGRLLGEGQPKYLNSPETALFHKGRVLYNIAGAGEAARRGEAVVAVEGYTDVIALHQAGFKGAVAPLGTALTESHMTLLWRLAPEPILCFDGDAAGRRAAARAAERALPLLGPGRSFRVALLPEGEDPDSLLRSAGGAALREALDGALALVDVVWQMATRGRPADTPERRAAIRRDVRAYAARIADGDVQGDYLAEFERRLDAAFGAPGRGRGGRRRGARGARPAAADSGALGLKGDGNVKVLRLRTQQALLAAVINHGDVLADVAEALGTLDLPPGELDSLRQEILKTWNSGLDTGAWQSHLRKRGFSHVLDRVLSRNVYALAPFARPSAEPEAVRRGWQQVYALFGRRRLEADIEAAREALAGDMSERNWAYTVALKDAVQAEDEDLPTAGEAKTGAES